MADAKKVARAKTTLQKMIDKLPEAKRASMVSILEEEDALESIGEDGLRQDEFSRAMQGAQAETEKAKQWKGNLDSWWTEKQEKMNALEVELALLKEGKGGNPNPDPDPDPTKLRTPGVDLTGYVKKEDIEKLMNSRVAQAQAEVVPLVTVINRYSMTHFKDYGEILDTDAMVKFCQTNQIPIDRGGYEAFAKEKIEAKAAKTKEEEIKAAEKRGEERARAALAGSTPYPVGPTEPSTLDGLKKENQAKYGVDAAVTAYNQALAGQG